MEYSIRTLYVHVLSTHTIYTDTHTVRIDGAHTLTTRPPYVTFLVPQITFTYPNGVMKTTVVSDVATDYSVVPYNLTRLMPATAYSISVTASNDGGTRVSVASDVLSATTIFDGM